MNTAHRPGARCGIWSAGVLSFVACGLALTGALLRPVWHDELYTLALARMPLPDLLVALRVDSGPPLHYVICHALYSIVEWAEGSQLGTFMVRLPSVVAFALMPLIFWWWAKGRCAVFLWSAGLTMTWLPLLYFATEARAYAPLALVNAALWLLGPELIEKGGSRLALFAGLAAALPMLHYAGIVSFCFLPALAFFVPRSRWRSLAAALGAAALPVLAWSPAILGAPRESMRWVNTSAGPGHPGIVSLEVLAPAGPFPALFEMDNPPVPILISLAILLALIAALMCGAVMSAREQRYDGSHLKTIVRLTVGLAPVVVLGSFALAGWPVYFAGRTESMVWPLAAALACVSVLVLPRAARWGVVTIYAAVGLVTIGVWMAELPSRQDAIGIQIGRELAMVLQPKDRVVVAGLWQLEVQHGLAEAAAQTSRGIQDAVTVETLPRSQAEHPGWFDSATATDGVTLSREATDLRRQIEVEGGRVWLVWSPALPIETQVFRVFAGWRRTPVADSPTLVVDLLDDPKRLE